ncbi:hypothetical protein BT67DRAFT_77722 [Trichocladium antarcticum]|uniref:Uncharacterized protein n=1 Tax=Trichocladium antarcticum TaxID=1450529 RepID=A0AAN6UGM6_9PEZI|nr:hypothetical protein BT67DRAFT_77722 [Trichocladium antarcticum]
MDSVLPSTQKPFLASSWSGGLQTPQKDGNSTGAIESRRAAGKCCGCMLQGRRILCNYSVHHWRMHAHYHPRSGRDWCPRTPHRQSQPRQASPPRHRYRENYPSADLHRQSRPSIVCGCLIPHHNLPLPGTYAPDRIDGSDVKCHTGMCVFPDNLLQPLAT